MNLAELIVEIYTNEKYTPLREFLREAERDKNRLDYLESLCADDIEYGGELKWRVWSWSSKEGYVGHESDSLREAIDDALHDEFERSYFVGKVDPKTEELP